MAQSIAIKAQNASNTQDLMETAQKKCAVFVNRLSGGVTSSILVDIKQLTTDYGWDLYECASADDAQNAISAMAEAGTGLDVLVLVGGDGTIIHALTLMRHHPFFKNNRSKNNLLEDAHLQNSHLKDNHIGGMPQILAIAGGTTNMIHRDVGHSLARLRDICDKMRAGQLHEETRRPIIVQPIPQSHEHTGDQPTSQAHYGFFLATGAFADIITHIRATYHKAGLKTGLFGKIGEAMAAISLIGRLLCKGVANHKILHPRVLKISQDQESWQSISHIFTFFISLQKMILGIRLHKSLNDMQAISLTWPYGQLIGDLWRLRSGKIPSGRAIQTHDYKGVIYIKNIHRWVLDGEIFPIDPNDILSISMDDPITFLVE